MILYIFLIAHLLADFTFQPATMAEKKKTSFKVLLQHSLIYLAVFMVTGVVFLRHTHILWVLAVIAAFHFGIDWLRICIEARYRSKSLQFWAFVWDQILHIVVIVTTVMLTGAEKSVSQFYQLISQHASFNAFVLYILLFVLVLDPAAVFIKKLLRAICNETKSNPKDLKVGSVIGKTERLITVALVLCGQYDAVGLIIAAKSIARFKQLDKRDFAEKYLIGTLVSISVALFSTLLLKYLITQI